MGLEMVEDELVTLEYVLTDAEPEGVAGQAAPVCTEAPIVKHHLPRGTIFEHAEELVDVAVVALSALFRGTVRQHDDVLPGGLLVRGFHTQLMGTDVILLFYRAGCKVSRPSLPSR